MVQVVAGSYAGGTTVSGVARRHGLTVQQLFTCQRQLRLAAVGSAAPGFAQVVMDRSTMCTGSVAAADIVVEMARAIVRVPAGASSATVATELQALRCLP